jgi:hypothetical protein
MATPKEAPPEFVPGQPQPEGSDVINKHAVGCRALITNGTMPCNCQTVMPESSPVKRAPEPSPVKRESSRA